MSKDTKQRLVIKVAQGWRLQMSGHIISAEGKKVMAVGGKWNEYLEGQRCDEAGDPLPDAPRKRLWQVRRMARMQRNGAASALLLADALGGC